ncbi:MAG TPA: GNAT family N-acetyltransferase [Polyangia bacterium]|nr:GNAT family N-acetyltransferase [Polyangia bacterium]
MNEAASSPVAPQHGDGAGDADARRIEEASLRAWPALTESDFDGWRLRFADGYTRRANSITPLQPSRLDLTDKITTCERLYAERGLPAIFRVTPFAPPALETLLNARGYSRGDQVEVRARDLRATAVPTKPARPLRATSVRLWDLPLDRWLDVFSDLSGSSDANRAPHRRVLAAVPGERRLLALAVDERPVACGMSVLHDGLLGLFDLVTARDARGRGFGSELLRRALRSGARAGAEAAYLQVLEGNDVAGRLYQRAGFEVIYRYHYREPPEAAAR